MRTTLSWLLTIAAVGICVPAGAQGQSMPWVEEDKLNDAMAPFFEKWMEPSRLAVRIQNGSAEYRIDWKEDSGPFSFNVYATDSRAEAEELIQFHAEAENLLGGPSRLCLHKFTRAKDIAKEYFLLYLVDHEQSGLRCITLPQN